MIVSLKRNIVYLLILTVFMACNNSTQENSSFELNGVLEGISQGKISLKTVNSKDEPIIVDIIDGKFSFKGSYPSPAMVCLSIVDSKASKFFCVENVKMRFVGNANELGKGLVSGSKYNDSYNKYLNGIKIIKVARTTLLKEKLASKGDKKLEIQKKLDKLHLELVNYPRYFVANNPSAPYSVKLVLQISSGYSAAENEALILKLDPKLQAHPQIVKLFKQVNEMKKVEIGLDKIIGDASNVSYEVDKTFKGNKIKNIVYLGLFSQNNICAFAKDGTVEILSSNGDLLSDFKPQINGKPSAIAVDKEDNIYILTSLSKEATKKVRGKARTKKIPNGVECVICNSKGEKINKYSLPGVLCVSGARLVDNKLVISDHLSKKIAVFDAKTGKAEASIEDMRPCCAILDFSINSKKEILVANLGAFRIDSYSLSGKKNFSLGKRGKEVDDFHGCCNPVGVANLSNGAIVTVEKDPTRIKIYSREGAKDIAGIEEMVKGCAVIPMIVDSNDNLYLASQKKGIVKCVSIN